MSDVLKQLCGGGFWRGRRGRHQIIKERAGGSVVDFVGLMMRFHGRLLVGVLQALHVGGGGFRQLIARLRKLIRSVSDEIPGCLDAVLEVVSDLFSGGGLVVQQRFEVHGGLRRSHGVDEMLHVDESIFDAVNDLLVGVGGRLVCERVTQLVDQVEKELKQAVVERSQLAAGRAGGVVEALAPGVLERGQHVIGGVHAAEHGVGVVCGGGGRRVQRLRRNGLVVATGGEGKLGHLLRLGRLVCHGGGGGSTADCACQRKRGRGAEQHKL